MSGFHYRFPERFVTFLSGTDAYQRVDLGQPVNGCDLAMTSAVRKILDGSRHKDGSVHVREALSPSEKDALADAADTLDMCARDQLGGEGRLDGMADIRAAKATHRTLAKDDWRA